MSLEMILVVAAQYKWQLAQLRKTESRVADGARRCLHGVALSLAICRAHIDNVEWQRAQARASPYDYEIREEI